MGHREARRVPLDFDHPIGQTWPGYLAKWRDCPSAECDNGYTTAGQWLSCIVRTLGGLATSARSGQLHPWEERIALNPGKAPGEDMVDLVKGLSGDSEIRFGSFRAYTAAQTIMRAAGVDPETWGICPVCHGHSIHPDDFEVSEAWEGTEPPVGDGWQLWETTSEGSPVSPVFASAEELATWCETGATWFADLRWTAAEWLGSFQRGTTGSDSLLVIRVPG